MGECFVVHRQGQIIWAGVSRPLLKRFLNGLLEQGMNLTNYNVEYWYAQVGFKVHKTVVGNKEIKELYYYDNQRKVIL